MPSEPRTYSQVEVDKIVAARIREQGVEKALVEFREAFLQVNKRLDKLDARAHHANGLREGMVTNERFAEFEKRWAGKLVTIEPLGDGDYVVAYGSTGFRENLDVVEQQVQDYLDRRAVDAERKRHTNQRERWYDRRWGRAGIAAGVIVALATIVQAYAAVWLALRDIPHIH